MAKKKTVVAEAAVSVAKVPALRVVSSISSLRRGGHTWGLNAAVVRVSDLTPAEIAEIRGEQMLTVTDIEVDE